MFEKVMLPHMLNWLYTLFKDLSLKRLFPIISLCNWYSVQLAITFPSVRNCSNWLIVCWSRWKETGTVLRKLITFSAGRIRSILSIVHVPLFLVESYHLGSPGSANQSRSSGHSTCFSISIIGQKPANICYMMTVRDCTR